MPAATYRKTATVQAMQYTPDTAATLLEWMGNKGEIRDDGTLIVHTLEGPLPTAPGDWVLRGLAGEFWMNRRDVFEAGYELVAE